LPKVLLHYQLLAIRNSSVLRTLHHELLVNIQDGKPLVNTIVYTKPWFKSAQSLQWR
jgi:hypothetical protein